MGDGRWEMGDGRWKDLMVAKLMPSSISVTSH
jgi:hypothetical protein